LRNLWPAVLNHRDLTPVLDCIAECGAVVLVQRALWGERPDDIRLAARMLDTRIPFRDPVLDLAQGVLSSHTRESLYKQGFHRAGRVRHGQPKLTAGTLRVVTEAARWRRRPHTRFKGALLDIGWLRIEQLRPTQFTHGMREVQHKVVVYKALAVHQLENGDCRKASSRVYGPGDEITWPGHPASRGG
jgi:hypothetical protein